MMSLLEMSFYGGVMILAVTVLRTLTVHRLPKRTFVVLWALALVRLLIPFTLPSAASIYSLLRRHESQLPVQLPTVIAPAVNPGTVGTITLPASPTVTTPVGTAPAAPAGPTIPVWTLVWLAGVVVCGVFFAVVYVKNQREFRTSLPVENEFLQSWLKSHPLGRRVQIRQFDRISAPLTYGLVRPVILLPKETDWEDRGTLGYVLEHELVHIRRWDGLYKLVLVAAVCLHWFNPLVWVMFFLANRDLELSCDEAVVRNFGEHTKAAYARTLISMEETRSGLTPMCNNFSKNAIEERITAIMKIKKTSLLALVLACLIVVGTGAAFATSPKEEKEVLSPEEEDQILNLRGYMEGDFTITSYVDPQDGKTYYSWDQGKTFAPLTEEELAQRFPAPKVEWWTYEEYAAWLENEKAELQDMLGEKGWTGGRGEFVWTQEVIDETIAMYENILQEIKEGALYSKSVNGDDTVMLSQGSADMIFGATENGK